MYIVNLAIKADNAAAASAIAKSLTGFKSDNDSAEEVQGHPGVYHVRGIMNGEISTNEAVIGFLDLPSDKLDPRLRMMVARLKARLHVCLECQPKPLFGGCLVHHCTDPDCKGSKFINGIDRALLFCYDCSAPKNRCQRCGCTFEAQPKKPGLADVVDAE